MRSFSFFLLVAALLVAGCAAKPADNGPATNSTNSTGGSSMAPMAVTVTVGGGVCPPNVPPVQPGSTATYTIAPAKLELQVNMAYNLTLKNAGCGNHDLTIDKLNVKVPSTQGGQAKSVEFTPTQTGTFDMYCTIGMAPLDHRSNGMAGKVVVS